MPNFTILVDTMLAEVASHMLETGNTFPAGQWTQADILGFLSERQRFVCYMLQGNMVQGAGISLGAGNTALTLPGDLSELLRLYFSDTATARPLEESREVTLDDFAFSVSDDSLFYTLDLSNNLAAMVQPPPLTNATVTPLYTSIPIDPALGQTFLVPDDLLPIVKYLVMASMLSKPGESFDFVRADELRAVGMQLLQAASALMR